MSERKIAAPLSKVMIKRLGKRVQGILVQFLR